MNRDNLDDTLNKKGAVLASSRLSIKIMLAISASVLLISILFLFIFEAGNFRKLQRQLIKQQEVVTEGQALILARPMASKDQQSLLLILGGLVAEPIIVGASVSFTAQHEDLSVGEISDGMGRSFPISSFDAFTGKFVDIGSVTTYRTEKYLLDQVRDRYRMQALLILGILLTIATVVGLTIHAFVGRPLSRIMHALESAEAGTAPQVDWKSRDELGVVVARLNYLHENQQRHVNGLQEKLDLSERRELERLSSMANASQEAIVVVQGSKVVDCNARMVELSGLAREHIDFDLLQHALSLDIPELSSLSEESHRRIYRDGILRNDAGDEIPVEVHFREIHYGSDAALVVVIRDTSERKEAETAMRHMALHDGLTGLANRYKFMEELKNSIEQSTENATQFAVMYIDLDNFKAVNDTQGHPLGDKLLKEVARVLTQHIQPHDVAARLGGDEFALIINGQSSDVFNPHLLGEKIIASVADSRRELSISTRFGASVGYCVVSGDTALAATSAEELLAQADLALYHIKDSGKNGIARYSPEIGIANRRLKQLSQTFPVAFKNQELSLHFQPQVVCQSRQLVGFEALLRWHSPVHGAVPPESILQAAEQAGMANDLTAWIISTACHCMSAWPEPLRLAINLSANELTQDWLVEHISQELLTNQICSSRLEVEITETALIADQERTWQTLDQLSALGASIALDDFGTGYSSLSMLVQYPINRIKIDKSFVTRLDKDSDQALIASTMIELAHGLGYSVLAEGVEVEADIKRLAAQCCDEVQGFLIGKPIPAKAVPKFVSEYSVANRRLQLVSIRQDLNNYRKAG